MEKDTQDESPDQKPDSAELTRHPISYEEAVALTNEKHEFPEGAKELMGAENLKRICELVSDKHLTEADTLLLCGYMTPAEFDQYVILVDDLRKLRSTVYEIAENITDYICTNHQEKIGTKVEKAEPQQEPKGKIGELIEGIFKKIRGTKGQEKADSQQEPEILDSLMDVLYDIQSIIASQAIEGRGTFRGALLNFLMDAVYTIFSIVLMQSVECKHKRHNYSDKHREKIKATIRAMDEVWREQFGLPFSGTISMSARGNAMDVIYSNTKRRERFFSHLLNTNDLTRVPKEPVQATIEDLEKETDELFSRINDLSCFRKIDSHKRKLGEEMEVHIYEDFQVGSDTRKINRSLKICYVRIVLTPAAPIILPEKSVFPDGRQGVLYKYNKASFEVEVNRGTGELNLLGTQLPLHCVLRKDAYLALKKEIYQFILEHLEGKRDSFHDLLKKDHPVDEITGGTAIKVNGARQLVSKQLVRQPKTPEPEEEIAPTPIQQPESVDYTYLQQLRGLQGNRIYRAAETILGKPLRVSGSHHVFKSRNEGTCVIALHGSDQVGIGMLKTFLDRAGIPPQEFKDTL